MAQRRRFSALFPVLVALGVGCSAPGEELWGSREQAAATPFANDKPAYDYFVGKGLTNFQAAAVVGNLDQESGIDPSIHQANGGVGRGIAQWSAGARWDTTPNDNVVAYATQHNQSATSLQLQFDFIWYELTTFPAYGLTELKATTNVTDATQVFEDKFEGCVYANYPECALPSRVSFAKGVLAAYGADTGQGGSGGGGAAGGGGIAGSGGASGGASGSGTGGVAGAATAGAATAGSPGAGGSNVAGSGGASMAGAGGGGALAASGAASAGAASAGAPANAGASNVAGSGLSNGASSNDDSGCAFRPGAAPQSLSGLLSLLGLALFAGRRRRRA